VPEAADILARLDAILAELAALRAEVAGAEEETFPRGGGNFPDDGDDLAEANLLDTFSAQQRFGHPADSIRKWCREEDLGVRRGGRWLVSIPRLQRRLNGG
jgi:hypothetical protein